MQLNLFNNIEEDEEVDEDFDIEEIEKLIAEMEFQIQKQEAEEEQFYIENKAFEWNIEFPQLCDNDGNWQGFDAIVGNPPYMGIEDLEKKHLAYYKENFKYFFHRYDIFACFIERCLNLIKDGGHLSFIQPSTFLNSKSFGKIREFLVKENTILNIDLLKDGIFAKAVVPTMLIGLKKSKSLENEIKISKDIFKTFFHVKQNNFLKTDNFIFNLELNDNVNNFISKIIKNTTCLGEISKISNAINTGNLKKYLVNNILSDDKKYIKILKGASIKRWHYVFENYYLENKFDEFVSLGDIKVLTEPKLMLKRIGKYFEVCYDNSGIAALHTVHTVRITNKNFDIKYILALLNSRLINYVFKLRVPVKGDIFPEFRVFDLNKQVPIKNIDLNKQQPIIKLVNKILDLKNKDINSDTKQLEKEIDILVYKIYEITEDEIQIIEKDAIKLV